MTTHSPTIEGTADIFQAVSHPNRVYILFALQSDKNPSEIADELNMSRPGIEAHLNKLQEGSLVRKTTNRGYELSILGDYMAEEIDERINPVSEILESCRIEAEDSIGERVDRSIVSDEEWERIVTEEMWELADDRLDQMLYPDDGYRDAT